MSVADYKSLTHPLRMAKKRKELPDDSSVDSASSSGSNSMSVLQRFVVEVVSPIVQSNQAVVKANQAVVKGVETLVKEVKILAASTAKLVQNSSQPSVAPIRSVVHSQATSLSNIPIDLMTKSGSSAYLAGSTPPADWKPLSLEQKNKSKLLEVLAHFETGSGFDSLLLIGKSGTGKIHATPKTVGQIEVASFDVSNFSHMLTARHELARVNVSDWSQWIHGPVDCSLTRLASNPRIESTLDLDASDDNVKKVANHKHQQRIKSQMAHDFIRAILTEASYKSLLSDKSFVEYEKELDGSKFYCGLSLLWLVLEAVKPAAVVDAKELEKVIEGTTLLGHYKDDVRAYISCMRGALTEIRKKHGQDAYGDRRYTEYLMGQLKKSQLGVFRRWVEIEWTKFITNRSTFDVLNFETDATEIWVGHTHEDDTNAPATEESKKLALLTQQNKTLQKKVKALTDSDAGKSNDKDRDGNNSDLVVEGIERWRTIKKGNTYRKDGKLFEWCDKHKHHTGAYSGLYMRCNNGDHHDHELWLRKRKKPSKGRRDGGSKRKADDSEGDANAKPEDSSSTKSKSLTPVWKKERRTAFITDAVCNGMSDEQAAGLWERQIANSDF